MTALDLRHSYVPIAVTSRSGFDESLHHGVVVGLDAGGELAAAWGDPELAIYPRSANKPMQAAAMLRLGLDVGSEELALACASHDGTDRHVGVVRRLLAAAGLAEDALGNTSSLPSDQPTAERYLAAGGVATPIRMNCSGKHAAMVATCVGHGWDVPSYLAVEHPLQVAITAHVADLTGGVVHIGVDGCGAPAHVVSVVGLARAFRMLAIEQGPVHAAMTGHPELVGGDTRVATRLMRALPGLLAKDGAEGVFAAALPDGRAVAMKVADGNSRATGAVVASVLRQLGVGVDVAPFEAQILGHGRPVGTVRSLVGDGAAGPG